MIDFVDLLLVRESDGINDSILIECRALIFEVSSSLNGVNFLINSNRGMMGGLIVLLVFDFIIDMTFEEEEDEGIFLAQSFAAFSSDGIDIIEDRGDLIFFVGVVLLFEDRGDLIDFIGEFLRELIGFFGKRDSFKDS